MALSKRQQKWILKNRKLSAAKIASELNVDENEVEAFLNENKVKPAPKVFYLILILIPFIFIFLLEIGLRIFDYGDEYSVWVEANEEKLGLNPEIGKKYFSKSKILPESIQDIFDKEKKGNAFRVFVLGGSSAAGYPYMPLGSFSRYIEQRLKHAYPGFHIEVINISLTAVNTYTIRDFIPSVLQQKPDVILIYAGHNEYYGALGVGSMESLGTSREMVNLILYLNKYRTTQLVREFLEWAIGLFASESDEPSGTLMSQMAEDQSIVYNSDTYRAGIEQFRGNMKDIVEMIRKENVPFIIGNLASNLKDQPPFISKQTENYPSAEKVYNEAQIELVNDNYESAEELFRKAKDLDLLRFRAPEDINEAILNLSLQYDFPMVDIDSLFQSKSPKTIVGNNLMTDHLHPTLEGYQLIGKIFYEKMNELRFLPSIPPAIISMEKQDSLTIANYKFTKLDSTIADFRIKLLKDDYPFNRTGRQTPLDQLLIRNNYIDTMAYRFLVDDVKWLKIHREASEHFLKTGQFNQYVEHMEALISQYPIIVEFYDELTNQYLQRNNFEKAYNYALMRNRVKPSAFSLKWMGIIELSHGEFKKAADHLKNSLEYNAADPQVLYNLAGAYSQMQDYKTALQYAEKALEVNPNYPAAENLRSQLKSAVQQIQ